MMYHRLGQITLVGQKHACYKTLQIHPIELRQKTMTYLIL